MASSLRLVAGTAHPDLARAVGALLDGEGAHAAVERFPDGELRPAVDVGPGDDVYVLQPTGPPVHDHLVELLLLLDACRRAGAGRLTAVVPYVAYARQDRRTARGEGIGLRVVVDGLVAAGAQRLVVVDPHAPGFEAASSVPVVSLTALGALAGAVVDLARPGVVVAPDLGAVKLAERLAAPERLPVAVVRKTRVSGSRVTADELVGEVAGRRAVIVDDMIATGATIEAAVALLGRHGAAPHPVVAATHGLFVGPALARLSSLDLGRLVVTDTLPPAGPAGALEVCSVAPLLADALGRLHRDEPLGDLDSFG